MKLDNFESLVVFIEEMNYTEEMKGMLVKTAHLAYELGRMSEIQNGETALNRIYEELRASRTESQRYGRTRNSERDDHF